MWSYPQGTPPQPGNDALSYKGLFEHVLLLFLKGCVECVEKEKDRMFRSCRVGKTGTQRPDCFAKGVEGTTRHDPRYGMTPLMRRTA